MILSFLGDTVRCLELGLLLVMILQMSMFLTRQCDNDRETRSSSDTC